METAYNTNNKKRIVKKAALIFFIIVILLTFFSKTINNLLMPEVDYTAVSKGSLEKEIDTVGEIKPLDIECIRAWRDMKITAVNVKEGDKVSKGKILAVADKVDTLLNLKSMELQVLKAQNEYDRFKGQYKEVDNPESDEKVRFLMKDLEEAQKKYDEADQLYQNGLEEYKRLEECRKQLDDINEQIKALKKSEEDIKASQEEYERGLEERERELAVKKLELENFKKNITDNGEIRSESDGVVSSVAVEAGATYNNGQLLFEITRKGSGYKIEWKLNSAKAELLKEGDTVSFTLTGKEKKEAFESGISQKKYISAEGMYLFSSAVNPDTVELTAGPADINIVKKSSEYPMVIPNSCLVTADGGSIVVYVLKEKEGVMGLENYVKKVKVEVLDSDDSNTAVSGELTENDKIISFFSKMLMDGARVRVG